MKEVKANSKKYIIDFATKQNNPKVQKRTFFALAKKHLPRLQKKGSKTASQDIDTIVYGVK